MPMFGDKMFLRGILAAMLVQLVTAGLDNEHDGHAYHIFDNANSFDEARQLCLSKGWNLVTVTSFDEQAFLANMAVVHNIDGAGSELYYTGLNLPDDSHNWEWSDGSQVIQYNIHFQFTTNSLYKCYGIGGAGLTPLACETEQLGYICEEAEAEVLAVVCSTTEVVATLDTSALTNVDVDTLYIGTDPTDTNCQGEGTEDGRVTFITSLESCDSVVGEDDSGNIVYNFTLASERSSDGVIGRTDRLASMQFSCTYPSKTLVSSSIKEGIMTKKYMGSANGAFIFAFTLYDANDNLLDQDSEAPFGMVYAQIDFTGPSNLKMVLCNCVARPSEDNSAGIEHYLIKYGCYGPGLDDTVAPTSDVTQNRYKFQFETFYFIQGNTGYLVISCDVRVCLLEDADCNNPVEDDTCAMVDAKRSISAGFPINSVAFKSVRSNDLGRMD